MASDGVVGDYVSLQRGTTYQGSLVGKPGPALLGLGSIVPGGGFRHADFKTYGGECPDNLMLFPGDLYVSLKGATKDSDMIGSVARVPRSVSSGRLTQDTVRLVFSEASQEFRDYLYWLLRAPQYRSYCAGRATGSAVVALSRTDFLSFPVPPLNRARAHLVELFEAIEEKLETNRKMNETLEAMARALFKSWFVDFDPVCAKAEGRPTGLPAPIAALFPATFEDSKVGEIPKGWTVAQLRDHVDAIKGLSYKGSGLADSGMPMHNLNSIYEGGGYKYAGLKFYTGEYRERHLIQPGDVIVANTEQGHEKRLIGYAALVPGSLGEAAGIFTHHLYRLRLRKGSHLTAHYLCYLLNSDQTHDQVAGYTNGTTVNGLPIDGVEVPTFVCPPRELTNIFANLAALIAARCEAAVSQNKTLAAIRDSLLPELISGEIRISSRDGVK